MDVYKENYDNIVKYMKNNLETGNLCGSKCRFKKKLFFGEFIKAPVLIRQTRKLCKDCVDNNVSYFNYEYCYECAKEGTEEYDYYHKHCKKDTKV